MEFRWDTLRKSEQVAYRLRSLYEQYGYEKFRMGKFEEYDFYTEHKDFLSSGQILTFTDLSGKLMALKPDITMSIVKRTRATQRCPERLYYNESIYRASRESKEYREIPQIGLEYIGRVDAYANAELISLAAKSLRCIEEEFVLDISHMGFLTGLLDSVELSKEAGRGESSPKEARRALLRCIEGKNAHELSRVIAQYGIDSVQGERLRALISLNGGFSGALRGARELVANEAMAHAVDELEGLYRLFERAPDIADHLRLDFSITLNSKYYNGLMFRGYIKSAPRAVLNGGRYDHLLRRMGIQELEAAGFAIYFDELEQHLRQPAQAAYDAVVLYEEGDDPLLLREAVENLAAQGKRVFASTEMPEKGVNTQTIIYNVDKRS